MNSMKRLLLLIVDELLRLAVIIIVLTAIQLPITLNYVAIHLNDKKAMWICGGYKYDSRYGSWNILPKTLGHPEEE